MTDVKELIKQKNELLKKIEKEQNVSMKVELESQLGKLEAEIYAHTPVKATTPPTVDKKAAQQASVKAKDEKKKADAKAKASAISARNKKTK